MEATQPKVEEQKIKVKYNHEELEIPVAEAAVLAQKGMNYDKVTAKLQSLETELGGYRDKMSELAAKETQRQAEEQVRQLVGEGIEEPIAKQLVEAKTKAMLTENELTQLKAKAAVDNQVKLFTAERPDVNLEAIPDEVIDAAKKSGNLLKEFNAWESGVLRAELAEMRKKLSVKDANDANAGASMGSVESKGDATPVVINQETIEKMTPEQRVKNVKEIWAFLTKKG